MPRVCSVISEMTKATHAMITHHKSSPSSHGCLHLFSFLSPRHVVPTSASLGRQATSRRQAEALAYDDLGADLAHRRDHLCGHPRRARPERPGRTGKVLSEAVCCLTSLLPPSYCFPLPEVTARVQCSQADTRSPVIDGHIDVPILVREMYANNLASFDLHKETVSRDGHVPAAWKNVVHVQC